MLPSTYPTMRRQEPAEDLRQAEALGDGEAALPRHGARLPAPTAERALDDPACAPMKAAGVPLGVATGLNDCPASVGVFGPDRDYTAFSSGMNNTARLQGSLFFCAATGAVLAALLQGPVPVLALVVGLVQSSGAPDVSSSGSTASPGLATGTGTDSVGAVVISPSTGAVAAATTGALGSTILQLITQTS